MNKLYYNKDGWVCDRYPYDLACENKDTQFIEIDDDEFNKTFCAEQYHAWRVVNGKLEMQEYEQQPQSEINANRIQELKEKLLETDYEAIKFAEGEISAKEYEPIKTQRKAWRAEINSLEI